MAMIFKIIKINILKNGKNTILISSIENLFRLQVLWETTTLNYLFLFHLHTGYRSGHGTEITLVTG